MLSLVLATVDRVDDLIRFVECLGAQTSRNFELIIVDQNSDDRLVPVVDHARRKGITVDHIRQAERGLSKARTVGLGRARGDVVAFPDDDCWYNSDVVARVLDAFERASELDLLVGRWEEHRGIDTIERDLSARQILRFREVIPSSIEIFMRTKVILSLGGFDERLGISRWYGAAEETDLVIRLARRSGRLKYVPSVVIHHAYNDKPVPISRKAWSAERMRARGTGAIYAKHQLGYWVVFRGLASPLVRLLFPPYGRAYTAHHLATLVGRIEGLVRWRWLETRSS